MRPTADQPDTPESHERRLRLLRVMWAVFIVNIGVLALLAYVAAPPAGGARAGGLGPLLALCFGLGLLALVLSFVLRGLMLRRAHGRQSPQLVQSAVIVGFALCEAAALFGFVALFADGSRYSFLLFAAGAAGLLLHFPRREEVSVAPYKPLR